MRRLKNAALYTGFALAVFVYVCALSGCTSTRSEPTPDRPTVACIKPPPFNPATGNRVLPEIVRIIGITSPEDGERYMVIRGTYFPTNCAGDLLKDRDSCPWLPFQKEQILFICGREADAYRVDQP
jgi:hypothetical protein